MEACEAESLDHPAAHEARKGLVEAADPDMLHSIHPGVPAQAITHTEGYVIEMHTDAAASSASSSEGCCLDHHYAAEAITFCCREPGIPWHFTCAGTSFQLPVEVHNIARAYVGYPGSTFHGTPPVVDAAGVPVMHGNTASALITRWVGVCVSRNARRSRNARCSRNACRSRYARRSRVLVLVRWSRQDE